MVLGAEWTGNPSTWHPRPDPLMPAFHLASALWEPVLHGAGTSLPQALHPHLCSCFPLYLPFFLTPDMELLKPYPHVKSSSQATSSINPPAPLRKCSAVPSAPSFSRLCLSFSFFSLSQRQCCKCVSPLLSSSLRGYGPAIFASPT